MLQAIGCVGLLHAKYEYIWSIMLQLFDNFRFRISCRALAAMITLQVYDEMRLRLQPGQALASNGATKQEVGALLSMKSNKLYQSYKNEIEMLCDMVQNESYGLRQTLNLIQQISEMFYREKEYLSVLHMAHRQWSVYSTIDLRGGERDHVLCIEDQCCTVVITGYI